MTKLEIAEVATPAQLDELIEEATVDCHDEEEQASGFFAIIEDNCGFRLMSDGDSDAMPDTVPGEAGQHSEMKPDTVPT